MISLIVPFYNASPYLERCIMSIRRQSCRNFEVLLIDDFSTDDSFPLAESLITGDPRFHLLCNHSKGLFHARNLGIKESKGEYICFVDADDEVTADYLSDMADDTDGGNVDLVVHGLSHVFPNSKVLIAPYEEGRFNLENDCQHFFASFNVAQCGSTCAKLFRKSIIIQSGLSFAPQVFFCEDQFFLLSFLQHARIVWLSRKCNYLYYNNQTSMSTQLMIGENECESLETLQQAWTTLMSKYPDPHLKEYYSSFLGCYVHRVLFAFLTHPARKDSTGFNQFVKNYVPGYLVGYIPESFYTRFLKFCISHHFFGLFQLAMHTVHRRYGLSVHYVVSRCL